MKYEQFTLGKNIYTAKRFSSKGKKYMAVEKLNKESGFIYATYKVTYDAWVTSKIFADALKNISQGGVK